MKNMFLLLLIPCFAFTFKIKEKAEETIFLRKVEVAVKTHDADKLMSYIEPEYKRIQHDEFLGGNTTQFLNEFFCSNIPFTSIKDAVLVDYKLVKGSKNEYTVTFSITGTTQTENCSFFMVKNLNTGVFSIYSAVG